MNEIHLATLALFTPAELLESIGGVVRLFDGIDLKQSGLLAAFELLDACEFISEYIDEIKRQTLERIEQIKAAE